MTGNFRRLVIAAYADTPKDAPADDWLSLNIPSYSWMSNIFLPPRIHRHDRTLVLSS